MNSALIQQRLLGRYSHTTIRRRKTAEAGQPRRALKERVLNAWNGLRPALEIGATDNSYVTSMESLADEPIKANLKVANPRADAEEDLASESVRRLLARELSKLSEEQCLQELKR